MITSYRHIYAKHLNPMLQRRRHVRQKVEAPLVVWSIGSGGKNASRGHCLNLSESGAGAIVAGNWLPGQVVGMELVLPPNEEPVVVEARLRHRNRLYCGFEFLGPSDSVRTMLRLACDG